MSKAKLKAGDRVRVTHTDYPDHIPVGVIATVDTPVGDDAHLVYHGHSLYFFSSEFEVIPRFKVGDRVRLTKDNDGYGVVGDTGSVVGENGGAEDCRVKFDRFIRDRHEWWVPWNSMEHIYTSCAAAEVDNLADEYGGARKVEFKVGDRVRLNREGSYDGVTGTMVANDGDSWRPWKMDLDPGQYCNGFSDKSLWVDAKELEHVAVAPATLRIEAGKFYKTRDGRKVGPMEGPMWSSYWHDDVMWFDGESYGHDGQVLGEETQLGDLIAEWADEPVATAPKAKFKVGDRLTKRNGYWREDGYEVKKIEGDRVYLDDTFGGSVSYKANDEELVVVKPAVSTIADIVARHSQSGTAIVAVLENGQPRPATRPFVHGNADLATQEANRLARTNPGKEFGVYTLGTVAKVEKTYEHEWQRLAAKGERIKAVKALRELAGVSLVAAVKAVDNVELAA